MPLFRTGNGTTEDTVIVALELVDLDWFKRNLIGALELMCRDENWSEVGDAPTDFARDKANEMLEGMMLDVIIPPPTPTGATMIWWSATPPTGWLTLNGGAISKTTYPELFAIFGYAYGGGGDTFLLPTMASISPMGVGGYIALNELKGNTQVNIDQANLPNVAFPVTDPGHIHTITDPGHNHTPVSPSTVFRTAGPAGSSGYQTVNAGNTVGAQTNTASNTTGISVNSHTTGVTVASGGSGNALDIVHPVRGVYFIIKAG